MGGGPPKRKADAFWFKYVLSCGAATIAETAFYPMDLTKTRLQIQGQHVHEGVVRANIQLHQYKPKGMTKTALNIVKHEGFLQLWQGIMPAVLRHYVYTGCRMGIYEYLRDKVMLKKTQGPFPLWKSCCAGMTAGFIGQFFASPTDLFKVKMQMLGIDRKPGSPPPNSMQFAWNLLVDVWKKAGVRGLWRGWLPNCQRAALVNMADLATYDKVKHTLLRHTNLSDSYVCHGLSSVCSGFAAAVMSTPADVVKTRIMNQPVACNGKGLLYHSSTDCLMKTVRAEGFLALYKGFVPIWARMAPWSLTFWVSYEKIRRMAGASSF